MPKSAASPSILLNNRSSVFFNRYCLYLRRAQRGVFVCFFFMFRMLLPVRALVCAGSILPRTWAARSSPIFTEKGGFGGLELAKRAEKAAFYKVARSSYLPASRFVSARPPQFLIFSALFCVRAPLFACARRFFACARRFLHASVVFCMRVPLFACACRFLHARVVFCGCAPFFAGGAFSARRRPRSRETFVSRLGARWLNCCR